MTLDQLQDRDHRIAVLDRLGDARTAAETEEFYRLVFARKAFDRNLARAIAKTRRKLTGLEAYAAQHRLAIEAVS